MKPTLTFLCGLTLGAVAVGLQAARHPVRVCTSGPQCDYYLADIGVNGTPSPNGLSPFSTLQVERVYPTPQAYHPHKSHSFVWQLSRKKHPNWPPTPNAIATWNADCGTTKACISGHTPFCELPSGTLVPCPTETPTPEMRQDEWDVPLEHPTPTDCEDTCFSDNQYMTDVIRCFRDRGCTKPTP